MKKDILKVVVAIALTVVALAAETYVWYAMPCQTIKEWNLNAPGRCIK
jgi:hypothetical protein